MSKLTTRTRIIIVTTIIAIAYFALQQVDFRTLLNINLNFDPVKPLILALLIYLGTFWALFFKVRGERFITVLLFPAISIFALSFFSELILSRVLSGLGQLSVLFVSTLIFWVFTYMILLTVNILNATYLQDIPLGQAGRAAQFVLTLVTSYIIFFLLFSNDIFILLRLAIILVVSFLLIYISLWTIQLRFQQRLTASLAMCLLLGFVGMILSVWPIASPYLALVLSLVFYICLGISLEIREIISKWIWIEYLSLFLLILLMLVLLGEWGINGTLI